jgi:hypothetical protein
VRGCKARNEKEYDCDRCKGKNCMAHAVCSDSLPGFDRENGTCKPNNADRRQGQNRKEEALDERE